MKRAILLIIAIIATSAMMAQTMMPLPNHGTIYTGSVRGYWFTAPTDFVITGLRVPSQAGSGAQYIHLVKFAATPPAYSANTTNFTTLAYISGATNGVIQNQNIIVTAGDIIGVLGTAGTANSYATPSGPFVSSINGQSVTLTRLLYQGHITSGPAPNFSQEVSGPISRVELYWAPPSTSKNDIGVQSVDSPAVFCDGTHNVAVTVKNFGVNQVDSFTVNWSINGTLQTPVVETSLVLDTFQGAGSQTAQILLGSHTFQAGVADTIEAWTSLPNNVVDTVTSNDSAIAIKQPAIYGNFTIDPTGSGSNNYLTFTAAAQDLSDFGVCGPVTYIVKPGVYNEQVTFDKIVGTSSTNTITFTPDTGGTVSIEYTASGTSDNWVVKMDDASWISFDGFTFKPGGSSYSTALELNNGASHNTFMNCLFDGNTSVTGTYTRVIYCQTAGNDYNHFENNTISGGYYGVYFFGSGTTSRNVGNKWIGNTFTDQYYRGTYIYYSTDLIFNHNTMTSSRNYSSMYMMYNYYADGASEVVGNFINAPGYMGMYLGYYEGNANDKPLIANNMVRVGKNAGTYGYGLYCYGAGFARIVNNTVVATHSSYTYYGLYIQGGANTVMNNNYYEQNGYSSYGALYFNGGFSVLESDHNNIYTSRNYGYYNGYHQDLAAWQANTPWGDNSLNTDPGFTNFDSLRTCSDTLDGAGAPLSYITDDFDGDGRNPNTPDIGADEWVGSDSNAYSAGPDALVCGKEISIGLPVTGGTFTWSTNDTTSTITVTEAGTYTVAMTSVCGASHIDTVEVTDATATADFSVLSKFYTGQFTNTSVNDDSRMWVIQTNPADTSYSNDLTYLFPDNGPYQVDLYIYNDCDTDMVSKTWNGWVGVDENSLGNLISLMPNPATSNLNIQFGNVEGDVTVEMMNIQGQLVYSSRFMNVTNDVQSIDVSSLRKGMYVVKFITNNEIATKQVIVQ